MNTGYLVDTDIFVDFFRGHESAVAFINDNASRLSLSVIVLSELYAGVHNDRELSDLDAFCHVFPVHPIAADIARSGGLLKHQYSKSHGTGLADALIAATAQLRGLELKTLNVNIIRCSPD